MAPGWWQMHSSGRLAPAALGLLIGALVVPSAGCGGKKQEAATKETPRAPEQPNQENTKYGLTDEQAAKVLVKIGEREITLGDFAERLAAQSPYLRARYNSPERRREFLDNMIRFELLAIEANKRGHDELPEVKRVRKQVMVQRMMKKLFDDEGVKLGDIANDEIKSYYEANKAEFHKPEQVRASHILVKDKALAERILAALKKSPKDMQLFRKQAKEHNQDPATKARLGDLTFFYADASLPDQPEVEEPVRKAAFSLENTGDVYESVIKSDRGFHILKLTGKRAKLERSLEDAKRLIRNRLWREKREKAIQGFVEGLRKKADVKEDLSLLSQIKVKKGNDNAEKAHDGPQD